MGSDVSLSKAVRANLLSLQNTASMMDKTQNRLATGNKVNSALDNPSNFFTAAALNSRAADMSNLLDSMASGIKVIEAANNGITALTKNLESMQSTLRQARQDKSFQTQSFAVGDSTKITLGGGQFGDLPTEIDLSQGVATPGTKASLSTVGTAPYLGPQSSVSSSSGAGARSVISLNGGFAAGDEFTVAGVKIDVVDSDGETGISAEDLAASIQTKLDNSAVAGKYTAFAGQGDLEGKVVIETIDPTAAEAEVKFDVDNDPLTNDISAIATKGSTTFNYSAVTSAISVGDESIPTGTSYESFVANLKAKEAAGGYKVTTDDATKQITLTSTQWGGAAPDVGGIPETSGAVAGTKAKSEFTLVGTGVSDKTLTHTQTLQIGGATGPVSLTAGMGAAEIKAELEADANLNDKYKITVDADTLKVTLEAKTAATGPAPTVSSSQVATPASPSFGSFTAGAVDFTNTTDADTAIANVGTGSKITLTAANGETVEHDFGTGTQDLTTFLANLNDAGEGFHVEAKNGGFSISRADGQSFDIELTGTFSTNFGFASSTVSVPAGTLEQTSGIVGGVEEKITAANGTDLRVDANVAALDGLEIELTDVSGNVMADFTIGPNSTSHDLVTALTDGGFKVTAQANGLDITRPDGMQFKVKISNGSAAALGFATTEVTSAGTGKAGAVSETQGVADIAAVNGYSKTPATQGASVEPIPAEKNTFTVSYDGKSVDIEIGGVKGGIGEDAEPTELDIKKWQDATISAVNAKLKTGNIEGIEAQFDAAGKLQFVAKEAEVKTLAISGRDADALFGAESVDTGIAETSRLNSQKTVDKFVELINRDHGGKVRASNDNGKLRIENLSTQKLDIGINTDGAQSSLNVEGNTVRANLSKQFNELRDQLDKLADDSSFNGINLLRGDKLKITFNESGTSSIDIQAKDANGNVRGINASNLKVDSLVAEDLDTDEKIDAFLAKLSSALTELRSQASSFGSNLSSVENRQSFTKNMINTLETGAANLTLADTNEEAANLLALQTRQQLSSSALSMASQQDQAVLQLLR